jgi:phosphate butyryltransferase
MKTIAEIAEAAREALGNRAAPRIAAVAADDGPVLAGLSEARKGGLAKGILLGSRAGIEKTARDQGIDISGMEIIDESDKAAAAFKAMELVRDNKAELAMKGHVESAVFLRAALKKELGLNTGKLISHVGVVESPFYHKLLFLSDGALNIAPSLTVKIGIIENAAALARCLGIETPKTALLAALEKVNPRMPGTVEAAEITRMNREGKIPGCVVDGPLALDNALSAGSARIKGIESPVAGDADILIVPSIEAGNILYKALMYLGNAKSAGVVMGTRSPLILTSRAADAETRLASIALAVLAWIKLGCAEY